MLLSKTLELNIANDKQKTLYEQISDLKEEIKTLRT